MILRMWIVAILFGSLPILLSAQCCDHFLVMQDSYGDGWNGGDLQVMLNGSSIGTFAAAGAGNTASFQVCDGDQLQLIYNPGDWENENTYQLFDEWGNILFADGPDPALGMVYDAPGDCSQVPLPGTTPCAALPIDTANCIVVNNSGTPGSGVDPGCANYQGGDLWFSMVVPASGNLSVATFDGGGLNDTGLAIWTASDCFGLQQLACDDDSGDETFSLISAYDMQPGNTFYIQVFGYGGGTGAFELCVTDLGVVTLDSSELPIVMINTLGQIIVNNEKVDALMEMKYNGPGTITYVSDPPNIYTGNIGIEIRGASSSGYPQRPYAVETRTALGANNNVSLLGMPAENDWILLSNYNDRSLIRNQLAFEIFRGMGQYAPRTHLCEVLVDSAYRGIYLFGEKIKRDNGRVAIATLGTTENTGDDVTGGYILQQNYWNELNSFQSNFSPIDHPGLVIHFVYEYPKQDSITIPQKQYIAGFVDSLETALYSSGFADPVLGYRRYLDVKSFIDYFLVNELSRNNDGFKKSVFFHKDKNSNGGKLKAGPVWDFDWAWKNLYTCEIFENTDGSGWAHHINDCFTDNYSCGWYIRLLQDSSFNNTLRCTYEEYRTNVLSTQDIFAFIDSVGDRVQNAQARHFQKWPLLGVSGPAPEINPVAETYAAELDTLKAWISRRLDWLDLNIPGQCLTTSLTEITDLEPFVCFPNPSNGEVRFQGRVQGTGRITITIHDMAWREVDRINSTAGTIDLRYQFPSKGTFFYSVREDERILHTGKLIVL